MAEEIIPLADAIFCESCQAISRAKNGHCPSCSGSGAALVRLDALLNRPVQNTDKRQERFGVGQGITRFSFFPDLHGAVFVERVGCTSLDIPGEHLRQFIVKRIRDGVFQAKP